MRPTHESGGSHGEFGFPLNTLSNFITFVDLQFMLTLLEQQLEDQHGVKASLEQSDELSGDFL